MFLSAEYNLMQLWMTPDQPPRSTPTGTPEGNKKVATRDDDNDIQSLQDIIHGISAPKTPSALNCTMLRSWVAEAKRLIDNIAAASWEATVITQMRGDIARLQTDMTHILVTLQEIHHSTERRPASGTAPDSSHIDPTSSAPPPPDQTRGQDMRKLQLQQLQQRLQRQQQQKADTDTMPMPAPTPLPPLPRHVEPQEEAGTSNVHALYPTQDPQSPPPSPPHTMGKRRVKSPPTPGEQEQEEPPHWTGVAPRQRTAHRPLARTLASITT